MGKCKYYKKCPIKDSESEYCTKLDGMYYEGPRRPSGCYRKMELKEIKERKSQ
jgi:hypothetical protein